MSGVSVAARGLTVSFGTFTILEDLGFEIAPGEMCAVLGPNGGGKTTLLKCLLGLMRPAAGELLIDGRSLESSAGRISYVPQVKTLDRRFPALAAEVVLSGIRRRWSWRLSQADMQQASTALGQVGAAHLVGRSVAQLSGGELQRVYLARALARQPDLILLDEPATGVDLAGEADFHQVLDSYRRQRGATVMMVTHDWAGSLHHADKVLVLNRRQLAFGLPRAVLTDDVLRDAFGHHGHAHAMGWGNSDVHAEARRRGDQDGT